MRALFYSYSGERDKLEKTITDGAEKNISLRSGADTLTSIAIAINASDWNNLFNYIYIPMLNRYYFVDDVSIERNAFFLLRCSVDVLMSFRRDILINKIEVVESSFSIDPSTDTYKARNDFTEMRVELETPFMNEKQIVLIGV